MAAVRGRPGGGGAQGRARPVPTRWRPGTARYDSGTSSRRRACASRRPDRSPTSCAGWPSAGWRQAAAAAPPEAVLPDYLRLPDAKPRNMTHPTRDPSPDLRRPAAGDRDRAARVLHAVVAGDVRARAVQAVRASAWRPLRDGRLVGYLVCSRYDTVWHVMNVAVDDRLLREGIATALMEHLFAAADGPGEQYTLEVRTSNDGGDRAVRAVRLPRRRAPARLLPRQPRGRRDHVAHRARAGGRRGRVILALETSCDDTCAAVVTRDGRGPLERDRLAGAAARALRRRGAGGGLAPPPGAGRRGDRRRARERRRRRWTTIETVAVTRGPGLIGALLVGVSTAKALAAARELPLVAGRPPARPRGGQHARPGPDRAALPLPRGQRRAHLPRARGRPARLRGARPDARRRRRRGLRQGRAAARPRAIRAGPSSTGSRATATRTPSTSRARRPATGSTSASAA